MLLLMILLEAVFAQSAEPVPINREAMIEFGDYPQDALRQGQYGIVSVAVAVGIDGRVTECDVVETSRVASLDAATCRAMRKRGRFTPAHDNAGNPIAGIYYTSSSWGVDANQPSTTIDLVLMTPTLPDGYANPAKLRLMFDASGRVASCKLNTSSGNSGADGTACRQAVRQITVAPPRAKNGVAPMAVRFANVEFRTS